MLPEWHKQLRSGDQSFWFRAMVATESAGYRYLNRFVCPTQREQEIIQKKPKLTSVGPMWFWRTDHAFIEICNRKEFKKSIGPYRYGSSTASMLMVELLHVLKIAPGRRGKLQKYNTEYEAFDFCHYCNLKSKHLGFKPSYV